MNIKTNNNKIMITLKNENRSRSAVSDIVSFKYSIILICDYSAR